MLITFLLTTGAALWIGWLVALAAERRIFDAALRKWKTLPSIGRLVCLLALFALVTYAGTKPPPSGSAAPRLTSLTFDSSDDLPSVGTDETFDFSVPEDATVATNWLLRGAATDRLRLAFADWEFPFGGSARSNLFVHADGRIVFADGVSLSPFAASLGLVPAANWHLLPTNCVFGSSGVSAFWWDFAPDSSLRLTWLNALFGRETNSPVSFQAVLNPNGGFSFRYDLSRLGSDDVLTNVTVSVEKATNDVLNCALTRSSSSVCFPSADERRCDAYRAEFDAKCGDADLFSCPPGSTNTVLEHLFYSGTTNGPFSYPQASDDRGVLTVLVTGSGSGELIVGGSVVPLRGNEAPSPSPRLLMAGLSPNPSPLSLSVPRGVTHPVYLRGDASLSVALDSDEFAFGELPDLSGRRFTGWINFPNVKATEPCIHDYTARQKPVTLPVGDGAGDLTCTWNSTAQVDVENRPPRSALLTGRFSGRTTTEVTYTLGHPKHLFGQMSYSQMAHYCPPPPDADEDEEEEDEESPFAHDPYGEPNPGEGGQDEPEPSEEDPPEDQPLPGEEEPEDYDDAVANCVQLTGVLKLRRSPEYTNPIYLEVPNGHRNCCPCPDHATNWVAVVYQSPRLKVSAGDGDDFERSGTSAYVRVAGVRPSREPNDAGVSFATNGEITHECAYTVLGVGVTSSDADLDAVNACNSSFGLPVLATTNVWDATALALETDVQLEGGNIYLGFEDATAPFTVWVYDETAGSYVDMASSDGAPLTISMPEWRAVCGIGGDRPSFEVPVRITASAPGSATLVYRYWRAVGGVFVEDEARQPLTAVLPPVRADVDRDGDIDGTDAQGQADGSLFRFWSNQDTDKGDYVGQDMDTTPNAANLRVDGKLDLVNFFPVQVDVSEFRQAWGNRATYELRAPWGGNTWHCAVLNSLTAEDVNALQTEPQTVAGGGTFESSELISLGGGNLDLTDSLRADGSVMLAFEATQSAQPYAGPELVVSLDGAEVYRYTLPTSVTSVDAMYRYLNLRGAESNSSFVPTIPGSPPNLPDAETDGKHFVFVHGYNVNANQSRDWARAIFKRLWWSGSQSKFTAVDWHGDYSQVSLPVVGDLAPNYYQNVVNAFDTAQALKSGCDALPGTKVMLAHSLGNMLTCEAIARCGLQYSKYYMLNAAVPIETFDAQADAEMSMRPLVWQRYSDGLFACNWYQNFSADDGRRCLTWRGIFTNVHDAVNCYSPTEDVLGNAPAVGAGSVWSAQELLKGTGTMYLLPRVRCEGGWGFNPLHTVPLSTDELLKTEYTDEEMIVSPPFRPFADNWFHSTNSVSAAQVAEVRDRVLADGIPAQTFAAGANPVAAFDATGNYNYQNEDATPNGWPDGCKSDMPDGSRQNIWAHSDIKKIAYWYVYKLYRYFLQ